MKKINLFSQIINYYNLKNKSKIIKFKKMLIMKKYN